MSLFKLLILFSAISPSFANVNVYANTDTNADTVFEGYYRIEKNREHIGYVIQRVSVDAQTKRRTLTTYSRTKQGDADFFESTSAVASLDYQPKSSVFVTNKDAVPYQVLTGFSHGAVHSKTTTYPGNKLLNESQDHAPNVLGAFILLAADYPKLKRDTEYEFKGYAEERGRIALGTLNLLGTHTVGETQILHVADDYLGQYIENFVSPDGYPLGARLLAEKTVCFWVPTRKQAVEDLPFTTAEIERRFGAVPEGRPTPFASIKDAQLAMQAFVPPPARGVANARTRTWPTLPLRSR